VFLFRSPCLYALMCWSPPKSRFSLHWFRPPCHPRRESSFFPVSFRFPVRFSAFVWFCFPPFYLEGGFPSTHSYCSASWLGLPASRPFPPEVVSQNFFTRVYRPGTYAVCPHPIRPCGAVPPPPTLGLVWSAFRSTCLSSFFFARSVCPLKWVGVKQDFPAPPLVTLPC